MAQRNRFWRCGSGRHVVGQVQRSIHRVPQLAVYRHAFDPEADDPAEVDIVHVLIGRSPVKCDLCGSVRLWDISVDGMVYLFQHLNEAQVLEFSQKLQAISVEMEE